MGGTGFIGYHLAKKCLKLKWNVSSLSIKKPSKFRKLPKVKYLHLNIGNAKEVRKLSKKNFDYLVNLGGNIDHKNKIQTYKSHFLSVKNLFSVFKNKSLQSFIQIGSSAEYGSIRSPHKENNICKPQLIYGKSKLQATKFLMSCYNKFNFPVTVLRFYQVFGPRQKINRFIPLLIKACVKNSEFISSHGRQKRDFLYVDDAVDSIIKAIKNKNCIGKIINIGSGKPIELLKIMKYVKKKIGGGKFLLGKIKLRLDEPMIIYQNLRKSKKILKWKKKISFQSGIKKTIKDYELQIN